MTHTHLLDTIFRAAVWRGMHFAPLAVAVMIAVAVAGLILWRTAR